MAPGATRLLWLLLAGQYLHRGSNTCHNCMYGTFNDAAQDVNTLGFKYTPWSNRTSGKPHEIRTEHQRRRLIVSVPLQRTVMQPCLRRRHLRRTSLDSDCACGCASQSRTSLLSHRSRPTACVAAVMDQLAQFSNTNSAMRCSAWCSLKTVLRTTLPDSPPQHR